MCTVSWVGDHYTKRWDEVLPIQPRPVEFSLDSLTQEERDEIREFIRNDLPEFRKFMEEARAYDEANGEPDCENEDKFRKIREYAKDLGIENEIDFL